MLFILKTMNLLKHKHLTCQLVASMMSECDKNPLSVLPPASPFVLFFQFPPRALVCSILIDCYEK